MSPALDADRCWKAVVERDRAQDGFYYGVRTTGVYCRPGCASRLPRRGNVAFFPTPEAAEAAGLRPCLRCHPRGISRTADPDQTIRRLCEYIDRHAGARLTLAALAGQAGLTPSQLHRRFTAAVGVSPRQYVDSRRLSSFKALLRTPEAHGVTDAIYGAGYGSLSRVYEKIDTRLGMTPMEYRNGGRGVEITYVSVETPLGLMVVAATDRGLCFVQFGEQEAPLVRALRAEYANARLSRAVEPRSPELDAWLTALNRYLSGVSIDLRVPIHVRATAFQLKVWTYLQSIPAGQVQSYHEVAGALGRPGAARAVARACATNVVALAIPCHRVLRSNGHLGGYRWGLARKRTLIDRERAFVRSVGVNRPAGPRSAS